MPRRNNKARQATHEPFVADIPTGTMHDAVVAFYARVKAELVERMTPLAQRDGKG